MYSSSRNKAKVRLLAVHTTEGIMRATDLKAFFNRTTAQGSSHASADETGVLLSGAKDGFVDYAQAAWTLRSGNPVSDNIELCGFAKWKRADWLARPLLLDACARWLAERSVARGIPLVKLSPKEVAAGKAGVIGHTDWTVGMNDGTHWDPGPEFPYDVVLPKARAYAGGTNPPTSEEDDMFDDAARADLAYLKGLLSWAFDPTLGKGPAFSTPGELTKAMGGLTYAMFPEDGVNSAGEMVKRLRAIHGLVSDPAAFAEAVAARLPAAGSGGLSQDDVKGAIRDVLGSLDAA